MSAYTRRRSRNHALKPKTDERTALILKTLAEGPLSPDEVADIQALRALTPATFQTPDGTKLMMTHEARELFNKAADELLELRGGPRKEQG